MGLSANFCSLYDNVRTAVSVYVLGQTPLDTKPFRDLDVLPSDILADHRLHTHEESDIYTI